jgi:hypothetical protein
MMKIIAVFSLFHKILFFRKIIFGIINLNCFRRIDKILMQAIHILNSIRNFLTLKYALVYSNISTVFYTGPQGIANIVERYCDSIWGNKFRVSGIVGT